MQSFIMKFGKILLVLALTSGLAACGGGGGTAATGAGASTTHTVVLPLLPIAATNGIDGVELWKTDATSAGTVLVKDINPGIPSSSPSVLSLGIISTVMLNNESYFFCY